MGATGQQGSTTVRLLLNAGASVRALTRNPDSGSGQYLVRQGTQPVHADLQDADSRREAFAGTDGVFATTAFADARGTECEVEDGKAIADATFDPFEVHDLSGERTPFLT